MQTGYEIPYEKNEINRRKHWRTCKHGDMEK